MVQALAQEVAATTRSHRARRWHVCGGETRTGDECPGVAISESSGVDFARRVFREIVRARRKCGRRLRADGRAARTDRGRMNRKRWAPNPGLRTGTMPEPSRIRNPGSAGDGDVEVG